MPNIPIPTRHGVIVLASIPEQTDHAAEQELVAALRERGGRGTLDGRPL